MRVGNCYVEPLRWWERIDCWYGDTKHHIRCRYLTWQWRRAKRRKRAARP
jgi:hypothetical protein